MWYNIGAENVGSDRGIGLNPRSFYFDRGKRAAVRPLMSYTPDMALSCRVGVLRFAAVFRVFSLRMAEAGRNKAEAGALFLILIAWW